MPYVNGEYVMPGGTDSEGMFSPWPEERNAGDCTDPMCDEHPRGKRRRVGSTVFTLDFMAETASRTDEAPSSPSATAGSTSESTPHEVLWLAPWLEEATRIVFKEGAYHEPPCEILPWLYLGDAASAADPATLTGFSITHVLNVSETDAAYDLAATRAGVAYKQVDGRDGEDTLAALWDECWKFVQECRAAKDGKVLIHCVTGVNRSGLVATAALMVHEQMPVLSALRHVRARRGEVLTNGSFRESLVRMAAERQLLGPKPQAQA